MATMMPRIVGIAAFALCLSSSIAAARIHIVRGTIEKADASSLVIKQAAGPDLTVKLASDVKVFGVEAATISDVKEGEWIGVGAMPEPDGSQKAIEVTIFAPSQRGLGAGFRPWTRPGSTMTNGTAGSPVTGVDGRVVTVSYQGGEKKIVIGKDAKIRRYVAGSKAELKPGARIALYNPEKLPDGSFRAVRVNVGIGAMVP
jgi:hypothetical protein